jgi:hypothetical protein
MNPSFNFIIKKALAVCLKPDNTGHYDSIKTTRHIIRWASVAGFLCHGNPCGPVVVSVWSVAPGMP